MAPRAQPTIAEAAYRAKALSVALREFTGTRTAEGSPYDSEDPWHVARLAIMLDDAVEKVLTALETHDPGPVGQ